MQKNFSFFKQKRNIVIVCAVACALVGGGVFASQRGAMAKSDSSDEQEISSAKVQKGTLTTTVTGEGTLSDAESVSVTVPSVVKIDEIKVSEGDTVSAGDVLATVDNTSVLEAIASLETSLESVEDELDELDEDSTDAVTVAEIASLTAQEDNLETELSEMNALKESGTITASVSGTIKSINAEEGSTVSADSTSAGSAGNTGTGTSSAQASASGTSLSGGSGSAVLTTASGNSADSTQAAASGDSTSNESAAASGKSASGTTTGSSGKPASGTVTSSSKNSATAVLALISKVSAAADEADVSESSTGTADSSVSGTSGTDSDDTAAVNSTVSATQVQSTEESNSGTSQSGSNTSGTNQSESDSSDSGNQNTESGSGSAIQGIIQIPVTAPAARKTPMTTSELQKAAGSSDLYTVTSLSWSGSGTFKAGSSYTAYVTLKAKGGNYFVSGSNKIILRADGTYSYEYTLNDTDGDGTLDELNAAITYSALTDSSSQTGADSSKNQNSSQTGTNGSGSQNSSQAGTNGSGQSSSGSAGSSGGSTGSLPSGSSSSGAGNASGSGSGSASGLGSISGSVSGGSGSGSVSGGSGSGSSGSLSSSSVSGSSTASSGSSASDVYSYDEVTAFTISTDEKMDVDISIDELDINSIQKGQKAEVTVEALDSQTFEGEVTAIDTEGTNSGGSTKYTVTLTLDKEDGMLSGMTSSAVITVDSAENVLTLPASAITERNGKSYVYTTNEDGELSGETEVTTGLSDGTTVEITSGLSEGDTVYYQALSGDAISTDTEDSQQMGAGQMPFDNGGGQMGDGQTPPSGGGGQMPGGGSGNGS